MSARERFNATRGHKAKPTKPTGPQPASADGMSPSAIFGAPGFQEWAERNGLVSAFPDDEDDAFNRRVRGY
jgi:hypothetical protein